MICRPLGSRLVPRAREIVIRIPVTRASRVASRLVGTAGGEGGEGVGGAVGGMRAWFWVYDVVQFNALTTSGTLYLGVVAFLPLLVNV